MGAIPAALLIGVWFLLQLISLGVVGQQSSGSGVAYVAHLAGLIFGALVARVFEGGEGAPA